MNKLKNKRVLIFQQRGWGRGVGRFLARKFHAEGCKLAALTSTLRTHELIKHQSDNEFKYELIISHDEIISDPVGYLNKDIISLEQICGGLNIDSIWPIVWSLRMFVRSYKDKYYYGFKQNVSDEEIIDYVKAVYKCAKVFFNEFKPDIIIAPNFVSLHHIFFNLLAQRNNIKMIALTDSKIKNIYIFAHDYNESSGAFYDRVDELNTGLTESENKEKARKYIKEFREAFKKPPAMASASGLNEKKSWKQIIKSELSPLKHILLWHMSMPANDLKTVGIWPGYRPPMIILRDHFSHKKYRRFADNFNYFPLEKIKKFVYFPLQVQPETTIDVAASFFSNQIETARQIAMSLPDDYTLVVKDHPAMLGLHPSSYLEKIARTVNVKLVDYRIPSEKILKRADLVIGAGGTSLAEASFYYKPAIQLGNLGTTLKLPNVMKHTDMTTLPKKIKEMLKLNLRNNDYEIKLLNYVSAAYDTGVDLNYSAIWEGGEKERMDDLWRAYKIEAERTVK